MGEWNRDDVTDYLETLRAAIEKIDGQHTCVMDLREYGHEQNDVQMRDAFECEMRRIFDGRTDLSDLGTTAYATLMPEEFVQKYNSEGKPLTEGSGLVKNLFATEQDAERWLDSL